MDKPIYIWQHKVNGLIIGEIRRFLKNGKKSDLPFYRKNANGFAPGGPEKKPYYLFGLDSVKHPEEPVIICEGQKKQSILESLKFQCVASLFGSGAADSSDWTPLSNVQTICLLPDEDAPGTKYAQSVWKILKKQNPKVRIVILKLPGLQPKEDVCDFLKKLPQLIDWDGFLSLENHSRFESIRSIVAAAFESNVEELPDDWQHSLQTQDNINAAIQSGIYVPQWPTLADEALSGLVGEFVSKATENSEADPAAVLFTLLPALGIIIGPGTYFEVGDTKHSARLNALLVGATSRARKGTSSGPIEKLLGLLPLRLTIRVTPGPLASGEGLIYAVRDQSDANDKDGNAIDQGVIDKRLLVIEPEYGRALKAMNKEHNTLATTIRAAFDSGYLDPLTKLNRIRATNAHVGIVGHITNEELRKELNCVEIFSGTMNRFLLACVRRSKEISRPTPLDKEWLDSYAQRLSKRLAMAQNLGAVNFSEDATRLWDEVYSYLTKDEAGLLGALICRSEALTIRLALLYALLDDWEIRPVVQASHLKAALTVVAYSKESARYLYGNPQTGNRKDRLCQRILEAVATSQEGKLTQTQIHQALGKKVPGDDLRDALTQLQSVGKLTQFRSGGGPSKGAPTTTWLISDGFGVRISVNDVNDETDEY